MNSREEEVLGAWAEFFVSHALAVRRIDDSIAGKSLLTLDEYDLLLTLSRAPKHRLRFAILAEATVYTRSGITRIVKRLTKEGFLQKVECKEDRRGSFAVLTSKGHEALKQSWRCYRSAILSVFGESFTEKETRTLRDLLARLADNLSNNGFISIAKNPRKTTVTY